MFTGAHLLSDAGDKHMRHSVFQMVIFGIHKPVGF